MIERAVIENFRSIQKVDLRLSPLTCFVGPNGCGKSTLLDALNFNRSSPTRDQWRHTKRAIKRTLVIDGQPHHGTDKPLFGSGVRWYQPVHFKADDLRKHNHVHREDKVAASGQNMVNVFDSLPRRAQEELSGRFCGLVDAFADVDTEPTSGGNQRLRFQDRWSSVWFEPAQVSDGSLLTLGYLVLDYQRPRPEAVAIDEAERGVHPYLLSHLVDMWRGMAYRADEPIQVFLATHSRVLLDLLEPGEVRFLSRDDGGNLRVEEAPTGEADWTSYLEHYEGSLGSAWLSGGLGGVPGI